ncbi:MAG: hypothetical protein ACTSYQ_01330 [Candidatus Odinarchaeia archaeon]
MQNIDHDKIPIELEVIKTPKGDVPSVKSFKSIIEALNIIDQEIKEVRGDFLNQIEDLRTDIKSIKKLIAEQTVTLESLNEKLKDIIDKLSDLTNIENKNLIEQVNLIKEEINSAFNSIKVNQIKMEESFVKALESMAKVVDMKLKIKKEVK